MSEVSVTEATQRFYDALARLNPDVPFLNYGFAEPTGASSVDVPADVATVCQRLYEAVLSPFPDVVRVLEVGCGRGGGIAFLLEDHPTLRYLGLDLSKEHVSVCRRRFASRDATQFVVADATRLPVGNDCFEAAFSIEAVHHFEHPDRFYSEVARALCPDGWFFLAGLWRPGQDSGESFEACGFRVVERCDISANVLASLTRTSALRQKMVESLKLPERFMPLLMSWAGVRGYGVYESLASGSLAYQRYRLVRA